jgi:dephospho-CoA kinase
MQSRPLKIGITGGIGAGKSIVCDIFRVLEIPVYQADERARLLMQENNNVIKQIIQEFGQESYTPDGHVNRTFLANAVFNDSNKLFRLNNIVHPAVEEDFLSWTAHFPDKTYVLKEAALLVETGSYKNLDFLLTVVAPESLRIKRVLQRDRHRTLADIHAIISKQLAQDEKAKLSKFTIQNDDQSLLIPQILKIHEFFINFKQTG